MIKKYAQKRIYDALNRPQVYCFVGLAFATFVLGFITHSVLFKWFDAGEKNRLVNKHGAWWAEKYIGKTRGIDIERYISYEPIDAVYTWVNGSDAKFQSELNKYLILAGKENLNQKVKKIVCKLEDCVPDGALVIANTTKDSLETFLDCLNSQDEGVVVEDDNVRFAAFPKVRNSTACINEGIKVKTACLTSSTLIYPSALHPNAIYLSPIQSLGTFKDEKSLREELPAAVANQISDLKLNMDQDFALLLFRSAMIREEAEKVLQINQNLRKEYPNILPAFIVDCEDFIEDNALKMEAKPKRFVDNEELRYSLRALDKFAPWIRHVYIVTNGQIPYWLNVENEHLTLVSHEDIFGDRAAEVLPTFSSPAIESQLFRIDGIGEQFLYFNDDFFLAQPAYPEDFFTHSSGQKFYMTYSLPNCATGCPHTWIRDGYCDRPCNNSDCDFDGGDCQFSVNVTTPPIPLHPVDLQFALERAYCSNGCSNAWIADGFCDAFCNVPACAFDAGDCGGAILASQDHGYFHFSVVNASAVIRISIPRPQHIAIGNLTAVVTPETSFKIGKCTTDVTPALRTASFVASSSMFIIIAYRNISTSSFTAQCELTFSGSLTVNLELSFDTKLSSEASASIHGPSSISHPPRKAFATPKSSRLSIAHSLFDRFPSKKRYYVLSICGRHVPLVRRHLRRYNNGEITKLGLGVFLHSLLFRNHSCIKSSIKKLEIDLLLTSRPVVVNVASKPAVKKRTPGLTRQQQSSSVILSRFKPRSLNPANLENSVSQQQHPQLPADAYSGSLLHVNKIYNKDFGYAQRRIPAHAPLLIQKRIFAELYDRYRHEWLATSARRFRSYDDMQLQFSYMYYVMSLTLASDPDQSTMVERLFAEVDVDQSGDLSIAEMKNLMIRAYGSASSLQSWRRFGDSMIKSGCFENLTLFLSAFTENHASGSLPVKPLTVMEAKICPALRDLFNIIAKLKTKYKFESLVADDESVVFKMLKSNVLLVESWLNALRRKPPKFFCLNDDLDHSEPLESETERILEMVHDFFKETYPIRSQFELHPNFRSRFDTIEEFRRFKLENERRRLLNLCALAFVTLLLLVLGYFRWGLKLWRWCWHRSTDCLPRVSLD